MSRPLYTSLQASLWDLEESQIGDVERAAKDNGYRWVLGVDEVGRGPLVGPVTTAGVLVDLHTMSWCEGLNDSKKLSEKRREALFSVVFEQAPAVYVHHVHAEEVDRRNVLGASLYGMNLCAEQLLARLGLSYEEVLLLVDGKQRLPDYLGRQQALIKGDARSLAIAGASIVAKVTRDRWMQELHQRHPGYGFDRNKGYPTKQHLEALEKLGVLPEHRRSFSPVAETILKNTR